MTSIRRRLIVSLLGGSGLLVLAVGLVASTIVARRLRQEFDHSLLSKARALVTLTAQHRGEVEIDFADEFMPEFEAPSRPEYFQLWLGDGAVIERSRSLGERDLPLSRNLSSAPVYRDLRLPDGRPGRLVEIAFVPQVEDDEEWTETALDPKSPGALRSAVMGVARGREPLDALIRSLYAATLGTVALLMAGIALLVHFAVRKGLAPLREIGLQVQALDAERLDTRVTVGQPVRELAPVVEQLNALLARLESAFERERRFSSDVAHELRTPVAELRNLAEVGVRWPEDRDATRAFFQDAGQIALQMERTVATLLALARCEGGLERTQRQELAVPELLAEAWAPLAPQAEARELRLDLSASPVAIISDREKLRLILDNLLANAVAYSPAGSTVACTAQAENGTLEIRVSNPAPHLAPADLPHLFERFWRKDAARTNGQHAGLGLALARSFATLLGFDLTARLGPRQQLELRLTGPVGTDPPGSR
ncbi:MAG TPA: ATP-binding protein [Thermoanaerobaculia bacterium]|nr:ATP-binding protein [Thermoanaerobaculia bacterium]